MRGVAASASSSSSCSRVSEWSAGSATSSGPRAITVSIGLRAARGDPHADIGAAIAQCVLGGSLLEQQLGARQATAQHAQGARHHGGGRHGASGDPEPFDLLHLQGVQPGAGAPDSFDDPERMLVEQAPRLGELHAGALAREQRGAGLGLQLGHLLRDGGGRERQRVGGAGERAAPHNLDERLEPGEIHSEGPRRDHRPRL